MKLQYAFFAERNVGITAVDKVERVAVACNFKLVMTLRRGGFVHNVADTLVRRDYPLNGVGAFHRLYLRDGFHRREYVREVGLAQLRLCSHLVDRGRGVHYVGGDADFFQECVVELSHGVLHILRFICIYYSLLYADCQHAILRNYSIRNVARTPSRFPQSLSSRFPVRIARPFPAHSSAAGEQRFPHIHKFKKFSDCRYRQFR